MNRHTVTGLWDRTNRNGINDNFQYLFGEVRGIQGISNDLIRAQREVNSLLNLNKRTEEILNESQRINGMNEDVQQQIDDLILNAGESDAEVVNARGGHNLLRGRFEDIENKRGDFSFTSNAPQPPKKGLLENSYKIVRKTSNDQIEVIQKTSNFTYLRYLFEKGSGGSGYGVNYDLLRVVKVEPMANAVVYKRVNEPKSGSVSNTFDYDDGQIHSVLLSVTNNKNRVSEAISPAGEMLRPYTINPIDEVTYDVDVPYGSGKVNVAFFIRGAVTRDETARIKINGQTVKEVHLSLTRTSGMSVHEIDVPKLSSGSDVELSIQNTSSREIYLMGINVYELMDYKGQEVDDFISFHSELHPFISSSGASDYAIMNAETMSNFGSYHGGEVSNRCDIIWRNSSRLDFNYRAFDKVDVGEWCTLENFSIKQITVLIERAYMHSLMNFNTDGTLQMDFSYQIMRDKTPIPIADFWTSLTCTDPNFNILRQPVYMNLKDRSSGHHYFDSSDGYVIQEATDTGQELHIRFNRFNNEFNGSSTNLPSSISVAPPAYHKHYYAPIRNYKDDSRPVAPDVLQFSKGLDFYVH